MSVSAPAVAPATADRVRDGDGVMESCTLILFGASGDLTQRMVMPAIFRLARRGFLSPEFRVIGYARSEMTDDEFCARMREAVMREASAGDEAAWSAFAARLSYIAARRSSLPARRRWLGAFRHRKTFRARPRDGARAQRRHRPPLR